MIRIIEHGTRQITTCEACGCKFSFDNEDVMQTPTEKLGNSYGLCTHVICPQCKSRVVLTATR